MDDIAITDTEFEEIVNEALDALPIEFKKELGNILILVEDEPSTEQRSLGQVRRFQELFGLYQGVPLTKRGGALLQVPDKITLFKNPLLRSHQTKENIKKQIVSTLQHEVGHYFGLSEKELRKLHK